MEKLIPKLILEDAWIQLLPNHTYAVRCEANDMPCFRFGVGQSIFAAISTNQAGNKIMNLLDPETGDQTLIGNVPNESPLYIGRTAECGIKIMHAMISRKHLKLEAWGTIISIRDLQSTNGTYLYAENPFFDIDEYIKDRPPEKAEDMTLDSIHETFGPTLDDFLIHYKQKKEE